MPAISKKEFDYLKRNSETYADLLEGALSACKTADERLYAVNEYVGVLSDKDILKTWHGDTLRKRMGFAVEQISALPEPAVRKQGYKTVAGMLAYPDMFAAIGWKNAVQAIDETLETAMQDDDPTVRASAFEYCLHTHTLAHFKPQGKRHNDYPLQNRLIKLLDTAHQDDDSSVRLKAYNALAKRLQHSTVHGLLPDSATDQITQRLQDTAHYETSLAPEPTSAHTELQKNIDRLLREPQVIMSLHRVNAQTIDKTETLETIVTPEASSQKTLIL